MINRVVRKNSCDAQKVEVHLWSQKIRAHVFEWSDGPVAWSATSRMLGSKLVTGVDGAWFVRKMTDAAHLRAYE